jgi:phage/plasmid-like protein (TIGR03299 family)
MTTADVVSKRNRSAWQKAGVAVEATSAAEVARQAGLDWTVGLSDMHTSDFLHVPKKQAVVKKADGKESVIGVVGSKYKVFQNQEVFGCLDSLIDSGEARYAAAGEYDDGAKVWMLMSLPKEMEIKGDPHAAFLLAKTSHDGSSSVVIRPIIERLWCANQINRIFRAKNKAHTYTLRHTQNSVLSVSDMRNLLDLTYSSIDMYSNLANHLIQRESDIAKATAYFKKVWALPTKIEQSPLHLLSKGEKNAKSRALNARAKAFAIYQHSPTQDNIRGTDFGLWQAVVEYADHHSQKDASIATLAGRNDGIKLRALELLSV